MFDPNVAEWIGFTFRQLQIETGLKSNDLIKKISFEDMCRLYPGMHTISEIDAAERIVKMYNLMEFDYNE